MRNNSLFFATDKNIYDALHHKRITTAMLNEILLRKGIIVSSELTKEEMISEVCRLPHCYLDLQEIKEKVQSYDSNRESTTKVTLKTETDQTELKKVIDDVKKIYSKEKNGTINIKTNKDGKLSLELNYQDIDLSKTELRQIENKSIDIDFEIKSDAIDVRMPQNAKAKAAIDLIQQRLSKQQDKDVSRFEISLEAIPEPKYRSKFFQDLMHGLKGYEIDDVTNIVLNRENLKSEEDEEEKIETGFVKKAVLNGEGVNTSSIFSDLHSKGYYISRVAWSATPINRIGDRINIEVFFNNADNCNDFSYQIKSINNKKGDGNYNITGRKPTDIERKEISKIIEDAAENAYNIIKSTGDNQNEKV
ncbi:hypothetical protein JZM27_14425 [Providencia huaxiensis]|uniref:hypothetical protein n=1 Tax=Providencia TaxID=586 RepID=UPI0019D317CF|nr:MULTISPECIES: hypothetical protein [Providencia]MBN6362424.1 hypothetical protein [Providencia huaxiensis]